MKHIRLKYKLLFSLCVCVVISCNQPNNKKQVSSTSAVVDLGSVVTNLPDGPGQAAYQNNCVSCHSARYVQMQPNLSEKTWTALVTKMQKTFGAPIPDSSVKEIVQYLVTIRGKS
jgi:cytochrome c5